MFTDFSCGINLISSLLHMSIKTVLGPLSLSWLSGSLSPVSLIRRTVWVHWCCRSLNKVCMMTVVILCAIIHLSHYDLVFIHWKKIQTHFLISNINSKLVRIINESDEWMKTVHWYRIIQFSVTVFSGNWVEFVLLRWKQLLSCCCCYLTYGT